MRKSVLDCKELATKAGQMISFNPERYGAGLLADLDERLDIFLAQIPAALKAEYEQRYIAKYRDWLRCLSRCYSVAITGPSNFNPRRHEKRNRAEQAARERLDEWSERVIKRVNQQSRLTGWEEVERLQNKLEKLVELQDAMKTVNKIVRSTKLTDEEQREELAALGLSDKTINELMTPPQYSFQKKGFQLYQLSNNNAKIKATKELIARHTRYAESEDKEFTFDGGRGELNYTDERIRLYFDGVPDAETRERLKKNAYKWSPKKQAWQRQLTPNALRDIKYNYLQLANVTGV